MLFFSATSTKLNNMVAILSPRRPAGTHAIRHLDSLRPGILLGRSGFEQILSDLPATVRVILQPLYQRRLTRANGLPLLGELAPWFISDLLAVPKERSIERIAIAWQALYFSVLFLDDIVDGNIPKGDLHQALLAISLLQQRGVALLVANADNPPVFARRMNAAFESTALAALHEITTHRDQIRRYTPLAIERIGKKLHILRVCIDAISEGETRSLKRRKWLFDAFDQLVIGLQLLDDITDWREDLAARNMTLPLTIASARFGTELTVKKSHADLLSALVRSGALENTLRQAVAKLRSAERLLSKSCDRQSASLKYIRAVLNNGVRLREIVREAETELNKPKFIWHGLSCDRPSKQELDSLLQPIERGLLVDAQSSEDRRPPDDQYSADVAARSVGEGHSESRWASLLRALKSFSLYHLFWPECHSLRG